MRLEPPAPRKHLGKGWGALAFMCYVATIFLANYAIQVFGPVPVAPGLIAPAGVYFAGLAFTLRDLTHETWGPIGSILAVIIGAVLSATISPTFAYASGVAFMTSEMIDLVVYMWWRPSGFGKAVLVSNAAGLVADSLLFLYLAFGNLDFLWGQIVGKTWTTLVAFGLIWLIKRGQYGVTASGVGRS
jgi:uncharacterized PurR-regulated membrane protein YhhQ (DUF165 family)